VELETTVFEGDDLSKLIYKSDYQGPQQQPDAEGHEDDQIRRLVHDNIPEDADEPPEFIFDQTKRTKRFNTYKKRMIQMMHNLGARTGCYGILYLRRYCLDGVR
jgi:hypothetical protein